MLLVRPVLPWFLALALAFSATGCGQDELTAAPPANSEDAPHAHTGLPAGDGTRASYVGYSLKDVRLPKTSGTPGTLSFRIDNYRGEPVTDYLVELTKKMHVYVVSTDLTVFRHVHPTMAADGTWSGNLTLPRDGRYRLVAEFVAVDDGGNGDTVILGAEKTIGTPGPDAVLPPESASTTVDDVTVQITKSPTVGYENQMSLGITKSSEAASLGTYLGVYAHVSAFKVGTGELVHMHPLGPPEAEGDKAVLTFHTGFEQPGTYAVFVQTRLSGVVRTFPMTVRVTGTAVPAL